MIMNTYDYKDYIFTESSQGGESVRVQVTKLDSNNRPVSYFIYIPVRHWIDALNGSEFEREVIKGAFELLYKNGYLTLLV